MNPQELREAGRRAQEARERAENATPEPWESTTNHHVVMWVQTECDPEPIRISIGMLHEGDSAFTAHARTDVPELASLVDALVGEVEEKSRQVDELAESKEMGWARVGRAEEQLGRYVQIEHELSRRIETLEGALRFYADKEAYDSIYSTWEYLHEDRGGKARAALSGGEREGA